MNPNKAFCKFGDMAMNAPSGAVLTVGLSWTGDGKGWRVLMAIHTAYLLLGPKLRSLADEAEQKNLESH